MSYRHGKRKYNKHLLKQQPDHKRYRELVWKQEHNAGGFRCAHCKIWVVINDFIGTSNRNHCNVCLWSKHVDVQKGDRKADCHGGMQPVGLTFKHEGLGRQGELMLIHHCMGCGKISINRIARDDDNSLILNIFSSVLSEALIAKLEHENIRALEETDKPEIMRQLFGV